MLSDAAGSVVSSARGSPAIRFFAAFIRLTICLTLEELQFVGTPISKVASITELDFKIVVLMNDRARGETEPADAAGYSGGDTNADTPPACRGDTKLPGHGCTSRAKSDS